MNVFGIGLPEMAVIAAIGLLVFGPKRLPELGKTLGKTLRGFQSASQEFEKEFRQAVTPEPESGTAPPASVGSPSLAAAAGVNAEATAAVDPAAEVVARAMPSPAPGDGAAS